MQTPTDQPKDPRGRGRFMLNAYGRECWEKGWLVGWEHARAGVVPSRAHALCMGWLVRGTSLWIGAHYSARNRRWCINVLPCVTFWITLKGGITPQEETR